MTNKALLAQWLERRPSKLTDGSSNLPQGTIKLAVILSAILIFAPPVWAKKSPTQQKARAEAPAAKKPVHLREAKPRHLAKAAKGAAAREARLKSGLAKPGKAKNLPVANTLKRGAVVAENPPATPVVATLLQKGTTPSRVEFGCTSDDGTLAPVSKVLKTQGKTFRCQQTWDFESGKMTSYPAWVELFMPSAAWGAGMRETVLPVTAPTAVESIVTPAATAGTSNVAAPSDATSKFSNTLF